MIIVSFIKKINKIKWSLLHKFSDWLDPKEGTEERQRRNDLLGIPTMREMTPEESEEHKKNNPELYDEDGKFNYEYIKELYEEDEK